MHVAPRTKMRRVSMRRRQRDYRLIRLVARASLSLAIAGCTAVETAVVANPGAAFELPVGQTAAVSGQDVRITFSRVTEDSRCPVDVTCVWAGDAKIELTIVRDGSSPEKRILSITPPINEVSVGDLRIRFVGLAPAPRQSEPSSSRVYVAQLTVLTGPTN